MIYYFQKPSRVTLILVNYKYCTFEGADWMHSSEITHVQTRVNLIATNMSEDSQWDKVAASIDHLIKRLLKNITLCMQTLLQPLNDQGLPWSSLGAEHLVKGFQGALQIKTHALITK